MSSIIALSTNFTCSDILPKQYSKVKGVETGTKLVHRRCFVSNALTHIIRYSFKVQSSLLSILLDKLSRKDCQSCLDNLTESCLSCICSSITFNNKVNLALQVLSIIGSDTVLEYVKDVLRNYPQDDYTSAYWNLALFNILPSNPSNCIVNSLLLNHFNFKTKTRYQETFEKLSSNSPSLLWKTFRSVHSDYDNGKFDNKNIEFYINTINYYIENKYNNYIINGLFTALVHSVLKYLAEDACYNYFNIRNLIKGLQILITKFGGSVLKRRLSILKTLYKELGNFSCKCDVDLFCASSISLKNDLSGLVTFIPKIKGLDTTTDTTQSYPSYELADLSNENISVVLDHAINYSESLSEIKRILLVCSGMNLEDQKTKELLHKLREKYNELNDRGDIHLCITAESLYDDFGLRPWVRFPEVCDCP